MKGYSSQLLAKLQAEELVCFVIFDMKIDGTWYRFTDCDVPLVVDGHRYTPAVLQPKDVKHEADSCISSFSFRASSNIPINEGESAETTLGQVFIDGTPRGSQLIARMVFCNVNYYSAYAVNLLTNPGFETGALGDWHLHVQNECAASAAVVGSGAYKGTYCAKITITDGWGDTESSSTLESSAEEYHVKDILFHQHIDQAIEEGYMYDLTFAAKAGAARKIAADIGNRAGEDFPVFYNVDLTTSWQFFTLPFVAGYSVGAGSAAVNFYLARDDSSDDVYIDQVRISNSLYPLTVFKGYLDGWKWDEEWLDVDVVCALSGWDKQAVRKASSTCRWQEFKGEECGYSGAETWCDRTYERCYALSNQANFGGFRWLPRIMNKTIWWGRNPFTVPGTIKPSQGGMI